MSRGFYLFIYFLHSCLVKMSYNWYKSRQQWDLFGASLSATSPNIVVRFGALVCWVFSKGIKKSEKKKPQKNRGPSKGTFKFPPCSVIFAALPGLPDVGEASRSSGLNVAVVVDSQAHKESYIYRINDTLHPPHDSCLLHLVDWDCRARSHSHSATVEEPKTP